MHIASWCVFSSEDCFSLLPAVTTHTKVTCHSVTFSKGLVKITALRAVQPKGLRVNLIGKNRSRQLFSLRNGCLTYTVMQHLIIHFYTESLEDIYNFHLIFLHLISSPLATHSTSKVLIFFFFKCHYNLSSYYCYYISLQQKTTKEL